MTTLAVKPYSDDQYNDTTAEDDTGDDDPGDLANDGIREVSSIASHSKPTYNNFTEQRSRAHTSGRLLRHIGGGNLRGGRVRFRRYNPPQSDHRLLGVSHRAWAAWFHGFHTTAGYWAISACSTAVRPWA
jgi:hypothetical protein